MTDKVLIRQIITGMQSHPYPDKGRFRWKRVSRSLLSMLILCGFQGRGSIGSTWIFGASR